MRRWGVPALLSLLILAAVGFWGYREYQDRITLENYLNNRYQMSFYNVLSRVQNMEVLLGKSMAVAGKPDDTLIFSEIWLQSEGARENLTQLPLTSAVVGRTTKFLSQSGDFARVMAREINNGEAPSEEEYKTLNNLYRQSAQLNKDLHDMELKVADGKLSVSELTQAAREELKKGTPSAAASSFQSINQQMQGYPTLIYDGPFSDHLDRVTPAALGNTPTSADQARNIMRQFVDTKDDKTYRAQVTGRVKEKISGYQVELIPQKGNKGRISGNVSDKGGKVVWYLDSRPVGTPRQSVAQAQAKAQQYLESRGFKNMKSNYNQVQNGVAVFNFTPQQKGIIIYPDQVKVNVALDNGQIVGFDSRGYLMAHKNRNLPSPKITAVEAKDKVNKRMEITNTRLVVIPADNGKERLSYEVAGQLNGEQFLVYVNAITGKTDQVLRLINAQNGTLTM